MLEPLSDLGLLERKRSAEWRPVTKDDEIRTTALWRKFIRFAPRSEAAP